MKRRDFIAAGLAAFGAPLLFGGCRTFRGNSKINVAIIGCGRISTEFEVPGVLARPDIARIVAVCDLDMKRAIDFPSNLNLERIFPVAIDRNRRPVGINHLYLRA